MPLRLNLQRLKLATNRAHSNRRWMKHCRTLDLDHVWTMPQVLVRWEGNGSRRYDGKTEFINLSNVAAINNSPLVNPSIDQLSVGDYVEYEYVYKKMSTSLAW